MKKEYLQSYEELKKLFQYKKEQQKESSKEDQKEQKESELFLLWSLDKN